MKNRILTFIIGILVGAILTTIGFLIYSKTMNKNINPNEKMPFENNGQMQRPEGWMGEPPAKPEGDFRQQMQNNNI